VDLVVGRFSGGGNGGLPQFACRFGQLAGGKWMRLMNEQDSREGQPGSAETPQGGEENEPMVAEQEATAGSPYQYGVGDELRMRREAMGKSIADVVDAVRIQQRYIEALEQSKLEDLPGTVYALGFVRTYAEYLGLNGPEMVARYKDETEGLQQQTYVMPEPIEEGKVPTAAIFILGLVLVAVVYAVWYYLSNRDGDLVQQVPEVPTHMETAAPEPVQPAPPAPAAEATATPEGDIPPATAPEAAAPQPVAEAPAESPVSAAEAAAETQAPQPVAEAPVETPLSEPAPQPVAETPLEETPAPGVATQPVAEATVASPSPAPDVEPVAEAPAPPPLETAPPPSAVETVTLAPPPAETAEPTDPETALTAEEIPLAPAVEALPRDPQIYGLANTNARIVIKAVEDAWVEVTDAEESRLFSRVLRVGDIYRVPVRDGMTFVTGNAGGLEIMVDGEVVPSLGPSGQVRRNVKLDPGLLKSGKAWP
jgi:cytoskeletal protein RodZ